MNNAETPALYAFHVYGTPDESEDTIPVHYYNSRSTGLNNTETGAPVFNLVGIRQERRSLPPGPYITSGRKFVVR